MIKKKTTF